MTARGHFIVIEGLEGAGKSSAMDVIKSEFERHQLAFVTTHEPGGTEVGTILRNVIKNPAAGETLDPRTELLLLYASRVQLVEQVIRPSLSSGCSVLSDRFELSTIAYQGGGRGLSMEMIQALSQFCLKGLEPDLILFLDVTPEEGLRRALERSKADRIEQESIDFFNAVYSSYHEHIKTMKHVVLIDALKPQEAVQAEIRRVITNYLAGAGNQ